MTNLWDKNLGVIALEQAIDREAKKLVASVAARGEAELREFQKGLETPWHALKVYGHATTGDPRYGISTIYVAPRKR